MLLILPHIHIDTDTAQHCFQAVWGGTKNSNYAFHATTIQAGRNNHKFGRLVLAVDFPSDKLSLIIKTRVQYFPILYQLVKGLLMLMLFLTRLPLFCHRIISA